MFKEIILHLNKDEYPTEWTVVKAEADHLPKLTLQSNQIETEQDTAFRFEVTMYHRQRTQDDFTFEYPRIITEGYKPEYFDRVEYLDWLAEPSPKFYPDKEQFIPLLVDLAKKGKPDDNQNPVP